MARALDDLDHRHGGVEAYLTGPAGVARVDLQVLRARLVGPGA
jgi:hypothetical protein